MERTGESERNTVLKQYHELWTDAWKYLKNYAALVPMTEAKWEEAINILQIFVERHPDHEEFARKVIITVFRELERIDKENRKKCETQF